MQSLRNAIFCALTLAFGLCPGAFAQASASDPTAVLNDLDQAARNSTNDLSRLRIEKWKTDGNTKKGAQSDSESIQRNLSSALPELIGKVRTTPEDLNANFKLYRNLNVLYDVFSRFAETAGAFGSKEEFETLARDLDGIDKARRSVADRMDGLTTSVQTELNGYRNQARAAQAAAAAAPPKKVVIDDSEAEKKPVKKKKPAAKPAAPTAAPANSSTATPKG